jgi:hypothetical protein
VPTTDDATGSSILDIVGRRCRKAAVAASDEIPCVDDHPGAIADVSVLPSA